MTFNATAMFTPAPSRRRRAGLRLLALAAVVVFSGFIAACGSSTSTSSPTTAAAGSAPTGSNAVTIKNFTFMPATLTVKAGTTVTWTNADTTAHNIRFADKSIPMSPDITAGGGQATYSHTFTAPGTYPYICGIHNYMTGTIKVTP